MRSASVATTCERRSEFQNPDALAIEFGLVLPYRLNGGGLRRRVRPHEQPRALAPPISGRLRSAHCLGDRGQVRLDLLRLAAFQLRDDTSDD